MLVEEVITKTIFRPPGCHCGDAEVDEKGRVLRFRTCPVCMNVLLDSMRGREYAIAYLGGRETEVVLLKQKEFSDEVH